jgi:hypothetical protein
MAGDVTLKECSYTLTLALLWKAMLHLQHRIQDGELLLAPFLNKHKFIPLCVPDKSSHEGALHQSNISNSS